MAAFTPVDLKERSGVTGPCIHKAGAQCSNKGFLPMSTAEYLQDRTGQDRRSHKRGAMPKEFAQLFERLGISAEIWCKLVKDFGRPFSVVAGQPHRIDQHRSKIAENAHHFRIRREARELLATAYPITIHLRTCRPLSGRRFSAQLLPTRRSAKV